MRYGYIQRFSSRAKTPVTRFWSPFKHWQPNHHTQRQSSSQQTTSNERLKQAELDEENPQLRSDIQDITQQSPMMGNIMVEKGEATNAGNCKVSQETERVDIATKYCREGQQSDQPKLGSEQENRSTKCEKNYAAEQPECIPKFASKQKNATTDSEPKSAAEQPECIPKFASKQKGATTDGRAAQKGIYIDCEPKLAAEQKIDSSNCAPKFVTEQKGDSSICVPKFAAEQKSRLSDSEQKLPSELIDALSSKPNISARSILRRVSATTTATTLPSETKSLWPPKILRPILSKERLLFSSQTKTKPTECFKQSEEKTNSPNPHYEPSQRNSDDMSRLYPGTSTQAPPWIQKPRSAIPGVPGQSVSHETTNVIYAGPGQNVLQLQASKTAESNPKANTTEEPPATISFINGSYKITTEALQPGGEASKTPESTETSRKPMNTEQLLPAKTTPSSSMNSRTANKSEQHCLENKNELPETKENTATQNWTENSSGLTNQTDKFDATAKPRKSVMSENKPSTGEQTCSDFHVVTSKAVKIEVDQKPPLKIEIKPFTSTIQDYPITQHNNPGFIIQTDQFSENIVIKNKVTEDDIVMISYKGGYDDEISREIQQMKEKSIENYKLMIRSPFWNTTAIKEKLILFPETVSSQKTTSKPEITVSNTNDDVDSSARDSALIKDITTQNSSVGKTESALVKAELKKGLTEKDHQTVKDAPFVKHELQNEIQDVKATSGPNLGLQTTNSNLATQTPIKEIEVKKTEIVKEIAAAKNSEIQDVKATSGPNLGVQTPNSNLATQRPIKEIEVKKTEIVKEIAAVKNSEIQDVKAASGPIPGLQTPNSNLATKTPIKEIEAMKTENLKEIAAVKTSESDAKSVQAIAAMKEELLKALSAVKEKTSENSIKPIREILATKEEILKELAGLKDATITKTSEAAGPLTEIKITKGEIIKEEAAGAGKSSEHVHNVKSAGEDIEKMKQVLLKEISGVKDKIMRHTAFSDKPLREIATLKKDLMSELMTLKNYAFQNSTVNTKQPAMELAVVKKEILKEISGMKESAAKTATKSEMAITTMKNGIMQELAAVKRQPSQEIIAMKEQLIKEIAGVNDNYSQLEKPIKEIATMKGQIMNELAAVRKNSGKKDQFRDINDLMKEITVIKDKTSQNAVLLDKPMKEISKMKQELSEEIATVKKNSLQNCTVNEEHITQNIVAMKELLLKEIDDVKEKATQNAAKPIQEIAILKQDLIKEINRARDNTLQSCSKLSQQSVKEMAGMKKELLKEMASIKETAQLCQKPVKQLQEDLMKELVSGRKSQIETLNQELAALRDELLNGIARKIKNAEILGLPAKEVERLKIDLMKELDKAVKNNTLQTAETSAKMKDELLKELATIKENTKWNSAMIREQSTKELSILKNDLMREFSVGKDKTAELSKIPVKELVTIKDDLLKEMNSIEANTTRNSAMMRDQPMKEISILKDDLMRELSVVKDKTAKLSEIPVKELATIRDELLKEMNTVKENTTKNSAMVREQPIRGLAALREDLTKEILAVKHQTSKTAAMAERPVKQLASMKDEIMTELAAIKHSATILGPNPSHEIEVMKEELLKEISALKDRATQSSETSGLSKNDVTAIKKELFEGIAAIKNDSYEKPVKEITSLKEILLKKLEEIKDKTTDNCYIAAERSIGEIKAVKNELSKLLASLKTKSSPDNSHISKETITSSDEQAAISRLKDGGEVKLAVMEENFPKLRQDRKPDDPNVPYDKVATTTNANQTVKVNYKEAIVYRNPGEQEIPTNVKNNATEDSDCGNSCPLPKKHDNNSLQAVSNTLTISGSGGDPKSKGPNSPHLHPKAVAPLQILAIDNLSKLSALSTSSQSTKIKPSTSKLNSPSKPETSQLGITDASKSVTTHTSLQSNASASTNLPSIVFPQSTTTKSKLQIVPRPFPTVNPQKTPVPDPTASANAFISNKLKRSIPNRSTPTTPIKTSPSKTRSNATKPSPKTATAPLKPIYDKRESHTDKADKSSIQPHGVSGTKKTSGPPKLFVIDTSAMCPCKHWCRRKFLICAEHDTAGCGPPTQCSEPPCRQPQILSKEPPVPLACLPLCPPPPCQPSYNPEPSSLPCPPLVSEKSNPCPPCPPPPSEKPKPCPPCSPPPSEKPKLCPSSSPYPPEPDEKPDKKPGENPREKPYPGEKPKPCPPCPSPSEKSKPCPPTPSDNSDGKSSPCLPSCPPRGPSPCSMKGDPPCPPKEPPSPTKIPPCPPKESSPRPPKEPPPCPPKEPPSCPPIGSPTTPKEPPPCPPRPPKGPPKPCPPKTRPPSPPNQKLPRCPPQRPPSRSPRTKTKSTPKQPKDSKTSSKISFGTSENKSPKPNGPTSGSSGSTPRFNNAEVGAILTEYNEKGAVNAKFGDTLPPKITPILLDPKGDGYQRRLTEDARQHVLATKESQLARQSRDFSQSISERLSSSSTDRKKLTEDMLWRAAPLAQSLQKSSIEDSSTNPDSTHTNQPTRDQIDLLANHQTETATQLDLNIPSTNEPSIGQNPTSGPIRETGVIATDPHDFSTDRKQSALHHEKQPSQENNSKAPRPENLEPPPPSQSQPPPVVVPVHSHRTKSSLSDRNKTSSYRQNITLTKTTSTKSTPPAITTHITELTVTNSIPAPTEKTRSVEPFIIQIECKEKSEPKRATSSRDIFKPDKKENSVQKPDTTPTERARTTIEKMYHDALTSVGIRKPSPEVEQKKPTKSIPEKNASQTKTSEINQGSEVTTSSIYNETKKAAETPSNFEQTKLPEDSNYPHNHPIYKGDVGKFLREYTIQQLKKHSSTLCNPIEFVKEDMTDKLYTDSAIGTNVHDLPGTKAHRGNEERVPKSATRFAGTSSNPTGANSDFTTQNTSNFPTQQDSGNRALSRQQVAEHNQQITKRARELDSLREKNTYQNKKMPPLKQQLIDLLPRLDSAIIDRAIQEVLAADRRASTKRTKGSSSERKSEPTQKSKSNDASIQDDHTDLKTLNSIPDIRPRTELSPENIKNSYKTAVPPKNNKSPPEERFSLTKTTNTRPSMTQPASPSALATKTNHQGRILTKNHLNNESPPKSPSFRRLSTSNSTCSQYETTRPSSPKIDSKTSELLSCDFYGQNPDMLAKSSGPPGCPCATTSTKTSQNSSGGQSNGEGSDGGNCEGPPDVIIPSKVKDTLNQHTSKEMGAFLRYFDMMAHFGRVDVAYRGMQAFLRKQMEEETEHARDIAAYINIRGSDVRLGTVGEEGKTQVSKSLGSSHTKALTQAVNMEAEVTRALYNVHEESKRCCDIITSKYISKVYLEEQVQSVNKISKLLTNAKRAEGSPQEMLHFDEQLYERYKDG